MDISDLRRIGDELRRLNVDLEARRDNRTQALAAANEELSATLDRLRATQSELVPRTWPPGSLVAGIAHELNTPLGNSLLAATSLTDEVNRFTASMGEGVRRPPGAPA